MRMVSLKKSSNPMRNLVVMIAQKVRALEKLVESHNLALKEATQSLRQQQTTTHYQVQNTIKTMNDLGLKMENVLIRLDNQNRMIVELNQRMPAATSMQMARMSSDLKILELRVDNLLTRLNDEVNKATPTTKAMEVIAEMMANTDSPWMKVKLNQLRNLILPD